MQTRVRNTNDNDYYYVLVLNVKKFRTKFTAHLQSNACHAVSHKVACYPTRVNSPCLNPGYTGWYSIYLPRRDSKLS